LGLYLRFLIPKEFSLLNKVLFCFLGGLFLDVLAPQNLYYLGVPVRISAWLVFAAVLIQGWLCRDKLLAWTRAFRSNAELQILAVVIFVTVAFHGFVPIHQGLEWYYGKGHFDQINYVLVAEFLREEPYGTSEQEIGLRPWLIGPVGSDDPIGATGTKTEAGTETPGFKKERIGQSILTAEISVWSGTNAKGGYAATVIFFLTVLAVCLFAFLRESGVGPPFAAAGALLGASLPAVTRLSLDGFLSQIGILFIFPFLVSLLRHQELSARSFTVFISLTLAYLISVYSEIAPIGLCTLVLSVIAVRNDKWRNKRLMLMSSLLLVVLVNPYYLRNLIEFLAYQYSLAANAGSLWDNVMPNVLTVAGWSEVLFGPVAGFPLTLLSHCGVFLLVFLFLAGVLFLSGRDRLILGAILLPVGALILHLATRTPFSYYPVAKITLTVLPLLIGSAFIGPSRVAAGRSLRPFKMLTYALCAMIVLAAGAGSARYYSEVLDNNGLLKAFRDPDFLSVCRDLEKLKDKRVLIFETQPLLAAWLCYHARHNEVYFDGRLLSNSPIPPGLSFSELPDLASVDFVAARDRITDLKVPGLTCLTSVDDVPGESRNDAHVRYLLGPPARLRFLAVRPMSVNLKMRLTRRSTAPAFPIDFLLTDLQGHVFEGEISDNNCEPLRMEIPKGLSFLELSVKAKGSDPPAGQSVFPILAQLDGIELSDVNLTPVQQRSRQSPNCGSLEEGIKRDALLTSAMRPCRLRLTLTRPQPCSLAQ
jgi:hypothetical protein